MDDKPLPLFVATASNTASTGLTAARQVPDSLRLEFLLTDKVCGMNRRKFMKQVLAAEVAAPSALRLSTGWVPAAEELTLGNGFGEFSYGLAPVGVGDKWGFIDMTGQLVIPPQFYRPPTRRYSRFPPPVFSEGLAGVKTGGEHSNRDYGYIDKSGKIAIPPQYDDAGLFKDGLAPVRFGAKLFTGKYGFINKTGKMVIQPQYSYAAPFVDGLAGVGVGTGVGKKFGFIGKTGEVLIPLQTTGAASPKGSLALRLARNGASSTKPAMWSLPRSTTMPMDSMRAWPPFKPQANGASSTGLARQSSRRSMTTPVDSPKVWRP